MARRPLERCEVAATCSLRVARERVRVRLFAELGELERAKDAGAELGRRRVARAEAFKGATQAGVTEQLAELLDLVIDAGRCGTAMTTVINLTSAQPELVRAGQGALAPFGLE